MKSGTVILLAAFHGLAAPMPTPRILNGTKVRSLFTESVVAEPRARRAGLISLCLALLIAAVPAALCQSGGSAADTLSKILTELRSSHFNDQADGFDKLVQFNHAERARHPELGDRINLAFIAALGRENAEMRAAWARALKNRSANQGHAGGAGASDSEDSPRADLLGDEIQAVASLNDARAIPVLLQDIETGGTAQRALAQFGDRVVPQLLTLTGSEQVGTTVCEPIPADLCLEDLHLSALETLAQMATPATFSGLSPANRAQVRDALLRATKSDDRFERNAAIGGLGELRDRNLEPVLVRAAGDPERIVRIAAVEALGMLRDPALSGLLHKIAAEDPDSDVRQTAQAVLKATGGR